MLFWNIAHDFVLGVLASITASIIGPYDMIGFSAAAIFAFMGIVRWHRARVKEGRRGNGFLVFHFACIRHRIRLFWGSHLRRWLADGSIGGGCFGPFLSS